MMVAAPFSALVIEHCLRPAASRVICSGKAPAVLLWFSFRPLVPRPPFPGQPPRARVLSIVHVIAAIMCCFALPRISPNSIGLVAACIVFAAMGTPWAAAQLTMASWPVDESDVNAVIR